MFILGDIFFNVELPF